MKANQVVARNSFVATVLITGGHSGLGLECSKQLAAMGLNLVLAGRDLDRVSAVARQLNSIYGIKVGVLQLDVSSLGSVRNAAAVCTGMMALHDPLRL